MKSAPDSLLQTLLGDLPIGSFFADYWQKKPLHVGGCPDRFAELFDDAGFRQATRHCASLKVSVRDLLGRVRELPIEPAQVEAALRANGTVCISEIRENPRLDAFMAAFSREVMQAGDLSFNCYCSPDGQGFALHLDDHPVWILQIEGHKQWWYSPQPFDNPLTTVSFPPGVTVAQLAWADPLPRPDEAQFISVTLAPGDVLYLPEGTWHRAAAAGRSLALTLACSRVTVLDLVREVIGRRVAGERALNRNISGLGAGMPNAIAPATAEIESLAIAVARLRAMLDEVSEAELLAAWHRLASKHVETAD